MGTMKYLGIATLAGVATSTNVPIQIPTGLTDVGNFFNQAGSTGIFGATDFSKVMNHGCHCVKFGDYSADQQGGEPVDVLDAACKAFWERRSCIKLQGGSCNSYHHNGGNYPAPAYTVTATMTANGLQMSPDPAFHCQAVTDPCLRDICEIDHMGLLTMVGGGMGHAAWDWKFDSQCPGGRGIPNVEIPGFTCVGRGAAAEWAYRKHSQKTIYHIFFY